MGKRSGKRETRSRWNDGQRDVRPVRRTKEWKKRKGEMNAKEYARLGGEKEKEGKGLYYAR